MHLFRTERNGPGKKLGLYQIIELAERGDAVPLPIDHDISSHEVGFCYRQLVEESQAKGKVEFEGIWVNQKRSRALGTRRALSIVEPVSEKAKVRAEELVKSRGSPQLRQIVIAVHDEEKDEVGANLHKVLLGHAGEKSGQTSRSLPQTHAEGLVAGAVAPPPVVGEEDEYVVGDARRND